MITAALVAFSTGMGDALVKQMFGGEQPVAADATGPYGFTAAVKFDYIPCQRFALPDALTTGSRAAALIAGFPDPSNGMTEFLQQNGGAARDSVIVKLVLSGTTKSPTRILRVRPTRLTTTQPFAGTEIITTCGSDQPTINVRVDLDARPGELQQDGKDYFADHEMDVTAEDRDTLQITFTGKQHAYSWIIAVDYVTSDGKASTAYVDARGQISAIADQIPHDADFRLTGSAPNYQISYAPAGGAGFVVTTATPAP